MGRTRMLRLAQAVAIPCAAGIAGWRMSGGWDPSKLQAWCRGIQFEADMEIANWSATHSVVTRKFFQPETVEELRDLIAHCHATKQRIRPVGMALSPNGIAMSEEAMVSLMSLDKVLEVDEIQQTITVQAGIRVSQVLEELRHHGLTLQNFSSIQDQQMGGWTQVAAHGTGARLPTVEEMIVRMKLVTPARGEIELSETQEPELFQMAKVGLGTLGVVSEMTLRCVPQHQLREETYVTDAAKLRERHLALLESYRHVRYMWIPHTDKVVVVVSNPDTGAEPSTRGPATPDPTLALRSLHAELRGGSPDDTRSLSFAQLRDVLLEADPLNAQHVARVNQAEAAFWEGASGTRVDDSTAILGFECGGAQWVLETAFPVTKPLHELDYMEKVLNIIQEQGIPAPAPIEQRWTAGSRAPMSPAHNLDPKALFAWVGIIMYMPTQNEEALHAITRAFEQYRAALAEVNAEFKAVPHWAKIEPEGDPARLEHQRLSLQERYPVAQFDALRQALDPHRLLGNDLVDRLLAP